MQITARLEVEGMTCSHCVHAVSTSISSIGGVERVDVELVAGGASTVTIASVAPLERDALSAAIEDAGYTVRG